MTERKGNQDVYGFYNLGPLIENTLLADSENYRQIRFDQADLRNRIVLETWGAEGDRQILLHPSTACYCLRWAGYEVLSDQKKFVPRPLEPEVEIILLMGSAAHSFLQRRLRLTGAVFEKSFKSEYAHLSGRLDMLLPHPISGELAVIDYKFVSNFAFSRQINREGLPDYMRSSKGIYVPKAEHRRQLHMYMWAMSEQGVEITYGQVIYFNRDNGKRKDTIIMWDPEARYDAGLLIEKVREAARRVEKGELPDPSVDEQYVCAKICPFLGYCEEGQRFAREGIKKARKSPRPAWIKAKAREHHAQIRQQMESRGQVQPSFLDSNGQIRPELLE